MFPKCIELMRNDPAGPPACLVCFSLPAQHKHSLLVFVEPDDVVDEDRETLLVVQRRRQRLHENQVLREKLVFRVVSCQEVVVVAASPQPRPECVEAVAVLDGDRGLGLDGYPTASYWSVDLLCAGVRWP